MGGLRSARNDDNGTPTAAVRAPHAAGAGILNLKSYDLSGSAIVSYWGDRSTY